jgi:hypothetical protein
VKLVNAHDLTAIQDFDRFLPGHCPILGGFVLCPTTAGYNHSEENNQQQPVLSHDTTSAIIQVTGFLQCPKDEPISGFVP